MLLSTIIAHGMESVLPPNIQSLTIQKAQEKVIKTKAAYDTAVQSLQKLLDKRDAQRKDELWDAIIKSNKTYEDILQYVIEGIDVDKDVNE